MTDATLRDNLVNLTRELMLIQSDALHPENKKKCLQVARYRLESLPDITLLDIEDEGHPSLVALPGDTRRPDVLIVTHVDVVTHEEDDFPDPGVEGGRIIGPGAGDMKGIVAIGLLVFEALHREHPGISLGLAITTDEETGGYHGAHALLEKHGISAGIALVPDGGGPDELSVAEKGILHVTLRATGEEAHAARPWRGSNAVELLMSECQRIKSWVEEQKSGDAAWFPTCSITGFHCPNRSTNIIPAHAEAMMDIRFPPSLKGRELLAAITESLSPGVTISTSVTDDASALNPDPAYEACMASVFQLPVRHIRNEGGSDARFFSRKGIPVNMSRPLVGRIHADDEWIDISSMLKFYKLYEAYIRQACS